MKGKNKKTAAFMCVLMLAGMISDVCGFTAHAEEREYQEKYDIVFEDFNRENISDTVKIEGNVTDTGKSYLEVMYGDATASADDAIYKQAVPGDSGRGNLVIVMKSSDKSASLKDLILATRYSDGYPVYEKSFAELCDVDLDELPELTDQYQKYVINFANSYEDDEKYAGSDIQVNSGVMVGFHIFSQKGTSGKLEISKIYFTNDDSDAVEASRTMLNHFMGGDTVDQTAAASTTTWWCGSATGIIRKRNLTLKKNASAEIISDKINAGEYRYAVIDADGDVEDLYVATYDGSFSKEMPYNGSIEVDENTRGFRLTAKDGDVTVYNIFFTNFEEDVIHTEMPYIDADSVQLFDHFNVAQSDINGDYGEMSIRPEVAESNLYYRLSYNNSDKVKVAEGALVFDATNLAENDYINFKTESIYSCTDHKYVVFKVKAENGAALDGFRFGIGGPVVWGNGGLLSATGLTIASADDTDYVYRNSEGYSYIIVDIKESGLGNPADGVSMIDMYYSGTGKMYIDEIFFASESLSQDRTYTEIMESLPVYKEQNVPDVNSEDNETSKNADVKKDETYTKENSEKSDYVSGMSENISEENKAGNKAVIFIAVIAVIAVAAGVTIIVLKNKKNGVKNG